MSADSDKVDERRRKLVKHLATLGGETEGWAKKASAIVATTAAAIERDLIALQNGELPAAPPDPTLEISPEQLRLADLVESADTDEKVDEAMRKLCGGVLRNKVDQGAAKTTQGILMGRRFFLAQLEAAKAAKEKGGPIIPRAAPPLSMLDGGA